MKKLILLSAFLVVGYSAVNAQKVYSVDAEYKAGWKNSGKKAEMY